MDHAKIFSGKDNHENVFTPEQVMDFYVRIYFNYFLAEKF